MFYSFPELLIIYNFFYLSFCNISLQHFLKETHISFYVLYTIFYFLHFYFPQNCFSIFSILSWFLLKVLCHKKDLIPSSVISFYWSKVIYGFYVYFTKPLQPFIAMNKFVTIKIILWSFSKCFDRELLETPIIYNPRSNFLKRFSYDIQSHQMKIWQPCLYYTSVLKATWNIRQN